MDQLSPKSNATDSNLAVTLTVGQLRELVREEVNAAILARNGASLGTGPGRSHKPYLTVKEAADFTRLAPSTVRLYIRRRQLRAQKVGRRVIIAVPDLESFLALNCIEAR